MSRYFSGTQKGTEMGGKSIVVLATLDTKGPESQFLREQIERRRQGRPGRCGRDRPPDRPGGRFRGKRWPRRVGCRWPSCWRIPTASGAAPVMADGAAQIVSALYDRGEMHAIIGLGGTQGTTLCTKVMRALPYGVPKIMVSTMASGNVARWVDIKDMTMMFSVADILGLNRLTRKILANAAGAACGAGGGGPAPRNRRQAADCRDHRGHYHARGHAGHRGPGSGRLRDHHLPRHRRRGTGDGTTDARRGCHRGPRLRHDRSLESNVRRAAGGRRCPIDHGRQVGSAAGPLSGGHRSAGLRAAGNGPAIVPARAR